MYSENSFELDVARGEIPNWRQIDKFGRNPDVDTAAAEDCIEGGGGEIPAKTDLKGHIYSVSDNNSIIYMEITGKLYEA